MYIFSYNNAKDAFPISPPTKTNVIECMVCEIHIFVMHISQVSPEITGTESSVSVFAGTKYMAFTVNYNFEL
jgi:hypothetical protein